MASTYVLPGDTMAHTHRHHGHGHMHARSRSPSAPLGALNRSFKMDSASSIPLFDLDHDHDHDHNHDHHYHHEPEHDHSNSLPSFPSQNYSLSHSPNRDSLPINSARANSNLPLQPRTNIPAPLSPSPGWSMTSTVGGKPLVTPTNPTFAGVYKAPEAQPSEPAHDHSAERSGFTNMLLPCTSKWPLLHAVMTEKDSRRIFYFMSLNFSFMTIQAFYGYVTDSLGLLSDSIHMFFDCVALAVGLFAAVASKWPPSDRFPYGFGKVETLSGFANGVFLVLISVEIMIEAFERIIEGRQTKRLVELFIVSSLGLIVNLVGMAAFGHHHHGHSHGHAYEHSHSHSHSHAHGMDGPAHDHGHDHEHDHDHDHDHSHAHDHGNHHVHSHDNENMRGIYLHVLADTLGSGAVIASTALTHFIPWSGWDPLASFLIAVLIMGSAMPLVTSSARTLLLTIPDPIEYSLRDTLSGITGLRGVSSYSVPKFWIDDRNSGDDAPGDRLMGVMHVVAVRGADTEDVRDRVRNYLSEKGIDATIQVEREGDATCWCAASKSPMSPLTPLIGGGSQGSKVL